MRLVIVAEDRVAVPPAIVTVWKVPVPPVIVTFELLKFWMFAVPSVMLTFPMARFAKLVPAPNEMEDACRFATARLDMFAKFRFAVPDVMFTVAMLIALYVALPKSIPDTTLMDVQLIALNLVAA